MVMERQYISAEQFLEIANRPEYDDCIVELVEGVFVEMPLPNAEHGEILSLLHAKIANFVYQKKLGRVTVGDSGLILERNQVGRDTIRGLDLAFIGKAKAPEPLPRGLLTIPPDLAVEIISPSNEAADIRLKIRQLLDAGTVLVWTVYPDLQIVDVHTPDGSTTLNATDTLTGGDILPGFEVPVADIFPS